jgi:hypothetical protein
MLALSASECKREMIASRIVAQASNAAASSLYTSHKFLLYQLLRLNESDGRRLVVSAINQALRLSSSLLIRDVYNAERRGSGAAANWHAMPSETAPIIQAGSPPPAAAELEGYSPSPGENTTGVKACSILSHRSGLSNPAVLRTVLRAN